MPPKIKLGLRWKKGYAPRKKTRLVLRRKKPRATSGYNYSSVPAVVAPNNLFIKLNYAKAMTVTSVAANSFSDLFIGGNLLAPTGPNVTDDFPQNPTLGQQVISSGSQLWMGIDAYANLFRHLTIFSSSMTFKLITDSTGGASTNVNLQVLGSAFSEAGLPSTGLQFIGTQTLREQKGVKSRVVAGGAGNNKTSIYLARSTKKILGCKDYRDRVNSWNVVSPGNNVNIIRNVSPENQWYYYIRVYNPNSIPVDFTWSLYMQCNAMFSNRTFWTSSNATAGAPPT